jgi:hypothetical protein
LGKIILEVKDEDLLQLGKIRIREEIEQTLKWMKIKKLLKGISKAVSSLKVDYEKEIEMIKEEAWQEYKKELPL